MDIQFLATQHTYHIPETHRRKSYLNFPSKLFWKVFAISVLNISPLSLSISLSQFVCLHSTCYYLILQYVWYERPGTWWTASFPRAGISSVLFTTLISSTLKLLVIEFCLGWCGWWPEWSFIFHSSVPSVFFKALIMC